MPRSYPPEYRRRVLDLIESGKTVAEVADGLEVTAQTIYIWWKQHLIDTGRKAETTSSDNAEFLTARTVRSATPKQVRSVPAAAAATSAALDLHREAAARHRALVDGQIDVSILPEIGVSGDFMPDPLLVQAEALERVHGLPPGDPGLRHTHCVLHLEVAR